LQEWLSLAPSVRDGPARSGGVDTGPDPDPVPARPTPDPASVLDSEGAPANVSEPAGT